jgi:tetratricopeptide (TPR) repeat protein
MRYESLRFPVYLVLGCTVIAMGLMSRTTPRPHPGSWEAHIQPMFDLHAQGKKEESLALAQSFLAEAEANFAPLDIRRIEALHHVGWLNQDLQRWDTAGFYLHRSLDLYRKLEEASKTNPELAMMKPPGVHGIGNELHLLGGVYYFKGNYEEALRYFKDAVEFFRNKPQFRNTYIDCIKWTASTYKALGDSPNLEATLATLKTLGVVDWRP